MEILSNPFAIPSSPKGRAALPPRGPSSSIFGRRSSRVPDSQRNIKNITLSVHHDAFVGFIDQTPQSPVSVNGPSRRTSVYGFLPLPSISASPISTPTTSMSSRPLCLNSDSEEEKEISSVSVADSATAPISPLERLSMKVDLSPPTWISTPPTPPPKLVRRSATCLSRRPPSPRLPPSASFPASMSLHAPSYPPKRRASVAVMSSPRSSSSLDAVGHKHRLANHDTKTIASPLRTTILPSRGDIDATEENTRIPATRSKPLFRISLEVSTENEDNGYGLVESPKSMGDETSPRGSLNGYFSSDEGSKEKTKDDIRKYHALMELLATEVGYLMDLRALVTIYLRNLPTLTCRPSSGSSFGRPHSSFTSNSRANSYTQLHSSALSASVILPDSNVTPSLSSTHGKEKDKAMPRYLFTDTEIELLTRNAEEVLQLHEHFVEELRAIVAPLGFLMALETVGEGEEKQKEDTGSLIQNIDVAIGAVSTKFATDASRFNSYQLFCTGHPEALNLVRKIRQQYPVEWDAFEQRCSAMVSSMFDAELKTSGNNDETPPHAPSPVECNSTSSNISTYIERKRNTSLTSVDGAVRTLRSKASLGFKDPVGIPPDVGVRKEGQGSRRLAFMDYMIKPVQRICKYPLLLDQLRTGKSLRAMSLPHTVVRSDVNVVVESATQAMRHVASSVDEARHRQDVAIQSALIVSRISLASPMTTVAHLSSVHPAFQVLTPTFLSSLGTCLLAGSLDVMHYQSFKALGNRGSIKAKYLGAFLYLGGYFVLVKVCKGKVYEPRHWFPLADFEIDDVEEDEAMLPCSFRFSCGGHQFELAAACQREKDAWMTSILEALSHPPSWTNEPTSSLQFDGKGDLIPSPLDGVPFEAINALPTIQSIPEFANSQDYPEPEPPTPTFLSDTKQAKTFSRNDMPFKPDGVSQPSRRSSSASVKAIFSPMTSDSDTIVIRRSSPTARSQVDQGLQDVISEPCLTARSHASSHEEDLFQAPKITRSGFVRSNSALSMASMGVVAKNRLTRHESVRVPRRKSFLDGPDSIPTRPPISRGKSLATRRQTKNLSITSLSEVQNGLFIPDSDPSSYSPNTFSQCSVSNPSSTLSSPTNDSIHFPYHPVNHAHESDHHKRPRSLVSNVRGLFYPRPTSPITLNASFLNQGTTADVEGNSNKTPAPGLLKRWAKGTLHRRVRSAPEIPKELLPLPKDPAFAIPDSSPSSPNPHFGVELSYTYSPEDLQPSSPKTPARRRSLLPTPSYRYPVPAEADSTPREVHKNFSLLQRLKAIEVGYLPM